MNEQLEYIDDYFQQQLSDTQKAEFEAKCIADPEFAKEVAFYINSREALRAILLDEKKKEWALLTPKEEVEIVEAPVRKMQFKKWLSLAVAACVVISLLIYPIISRDSGQDLVQNYVANKLTHISQEMGGTRDSMMAGKEAYNDKKYAAAISIFKGLVNSDPENIEALKFLGQSYLMAGNYDNALTTFRQLAAKPGLQSNPGLFLQGVTLVQRHEDGDLASAKKLFQQVVNEKLEGEKEATEFIKHLD